MRPTLAIPKQCGAYHVSSENSPSTFHTRPAQHFGCAGKVADALPSRVRRAVLLAPFIQPDFVTHLINRTETLHVVSLPESLDALPDDTIAVLDRTRRRTGR